MTCQVFTVFSDNKRKHLCPESQAPLQKSRVCEYVDKYTREASFSSESIVSEYVNKPHDSLYNNDITVPRQLQDERFVVLKPENKLPLHNWSEPWYRYTASEIQKWIDAGFNYAVLYTTDLAVFDADNLEELEKYGILEKLPDTYKVISGRTSSRGMHFYFRVHNVPAEYQRKKIYFLEGPNGKDLGDLRLPGSPFYNTAPYSVHPKSGRQYLPVNADAPISTIDFKDLYEAIRPIIKPPKEEPVKIPICTSDDALKSKVAGNAQTSKSGLDAYNFDCFDFLTPVNSHRRADGEIEGEHPVHGSNTGTNLIISEDGTKWYCRRHRTGGGWITALAVSEGIIDCGDANRNLTPDEWRRINDVLRRLDPKTHRQNWLSWKKAQILRDAEQRRAEA